LHCLVEDRHARVGGGRPAQLQLERLRGGAARQGHVAGPEQPHAGVRRELGLLEQQAGQDDEAQERQPAERRIDVEQPDRRLSTGHDAQALAGPVRVNPGPCV
jgi:hypothetical protein